METIAVRPRRSSAKSVNRESSVIEAAEAAVSPIGSKNKDVGRVCGVEATIRNGNTVGAAQPKAA